MLNLHERRHHVLLNETSSASLHGIIDANGQISRFRAAAARRRRWSSRLVLSVGGLASRTLALELALWLGAQSGLLAFPVAFHLLAHWRASGSWGDAACVALRRSTNSLALWATLLFAHIFRAANTAFRSFTVNSAGCTRRLFALDLALGALAHRVALCRANWVVALPATFRVALSSKCHSQCADKEGDGGFHDARQ